MAEDTTGAGTQGGGTGQGSGSQGGGSGTGTGAGTQDTGTGTGTGQGGGSAADLWEDGQPFDAERAKRTIQALRDQMKNAPTAQQVADLQAKVTEYERNAMTEQQRIEAERNDAKARAEALERDLKVERLNSAVISQATTFQFHNPALAATLVQGRAGEVQYDKDGKPTNIDAILRDIAAKEPYLVKQGSQALDAGAGTRQQTGGAGTGDSKQMNDLIRAAAGRA